MEELLNIVNNLGTPYTELLIVSISLLIIAVISYVVVLVSEKKERDKAQKEIVEVQGLEQTVEKVEEEVKAEIPEPKEQLVEAEINPSELVPPESMDLDPETPPGFKTPEIVKTRETEIETPNEEIVEGPVFDDRKIYEEPEKQEPALIKEVDDKETLFTRLRKGLSKTHNGLFGKLDGVFSRNRVDEELWDEFEESLITSDIGVSTTLKLREKIESSISDQSSTDPSGIRDTLKEEILEILSSSQGTMISTDSKPTVIVVAGVNGVGKTTTIGKLAYKFNQDGKKVMVAAADTFRAAAVEQLQIWSDRVGSDFLKGAAGADPSAVAFDAVKASVSRGIDILIIDTAGRLHTKSNLMDELTKIHRIIGRELEGAPHEVLLVLDATTGQNAIQQAKMFDEAIDLTGIVLTKLDGTAKGGVIIAIADELNIPVKYIGIGESLSDLREFDANDFVDALFQNNEKRTLH